MQNILKKIILVVFFFCLALPSLALDKKQILVVSRCLLSKKFNYEILGEKDNLRLIQVNKLATFQQMRLAARKECQGFMNVTASWHQYNLQGQNGVENFLENFKLNSHPSDFTRRYKIKSQEKVPPLFNEIDSLQMQQQLFQLTNLADRYVNSAEGMKAAKLIQQWLTEWIVDSPRTDVEVSRLATLNHDKQPSIVLRLGPKDGVPVIILGTPFDTLKSGRMLQPGANVNGSGTVTLLQTARILLASNFTFDKSIYFIWYAGSEAGKLGVQSVVEQFNRQNKNIDAVLHLDQTGFKQKNEIGIGLVDDATDAALTTFLADLVAIYLKLPVSAVRCGFACSDHMVWYQNNNRVAYPVSTTRDEGGTPFRYTDKDNFEKVSFDKMTDFVKLALVFVVELAML
ncbi:MAG: M20/M25/M40 family metallo-hydrolase [Gammaproteobacteria bacterium]|nr:M20/M25/M40 family metallo-hydrolase [Gammaproteobacteria bacterium]